MDKKEEVKKEKDVNIVNKDVIGLIVDKSKTFFGGEKKVKDNNEDKLLIDELSAKRGISAMFSKKARRIASVYLWERIGKDEVFVGSFPLMKGVIKALGEYVLLKIGNKNIFMQVPNPKDYRIAKNPKIGKVLEVVKFAEDDYRVRGVLDETFKANKRVPKMITKVFCEVCDKEIDKCVCVDKSDDARYFMSFHEKDKSGNPVFVEKVVSWEEPRGVTQEGRDSIWGNYEYNRRLEEYNKKNQGFWEKYGQLMAMIVCVLMICGTTVYAVYKLNKGMNDNTKTIMGGFNTAVQSANWWNNGNIINTISDKIAGNVNGRNQTAPPT